MTITLMENCWLNIRKLKDEEFWVTYILVLPDSADSGEIDFEIYLYCNFCPSLSLNAVPNSFIHDNWLLSKTVPSRHTSQRSMQQLPHIPIPHFMYLSKLAWTGKDRSFDISKIFDLFPLPYLYSHTRPRQGVQIYTPSPIFGQNARGSQNLENFS